MYDRIPGLVIVKDFVSEEEEAELLKSVEEDNTNNNNTNGSIKSGWIQLSARQVKHFGYVFDYSLNAAASSSNSPSNANTSILPTWTHVLLHRFQSHPLIPHNLIQPEPDQLTINKYPAGSAAGIAPHVDTHTAFDGPIVSVSLGANIVMEFRRRKWGDEEFWAPPPPELDEDSNESEETSATLVNTESPSKTTTDSSTLPKHKRSDPKPNTSTNVTKYETLEILVPRRSVLIMSADSRFGWEHSIRSRTSDIIHNKTVLRAHQRVSLTFRKVKFWGPGERPKCSCPFWWVCDAKLPGGAIPDRLKDEKDRLVGRHG
jgi:alkylated DNA repair protein alkB family protein 8